MTSARKKSELTSEEINLYWDCYFAAVDTLIVTQGKLEELEKIAGDLGERSGYRADWLRMDADLEELRARRYAFNADAARVNAPNQTMVDRVVALAKAVADEQVSRNRADAILKFSIKAMVEFSKIQK